LLTSHNRLPPTSVAVPTVKALVFMNSRRLK